jgi:hypothetical protein
MADTIPNLIPMRRRRYHAESVEAKGLEPDLRPYASLFLKPLTSKKSAFSKHDLEQMCIDPLHSPQLIIYLINFFKHM